MTKITHEQARKLAAMYCGGLNVDYSFSHAGLMLMLEHCLELGAPVAAQEEAPPREAGAAAPDADERSIIATYEKLHDGKLGAHWLWCVIEQIAAGVPEDEAFKGYGYYEPRAAAPDEGQARDAARYRFLREDDFTAEQVANLNQSKWDAFIDAAMSAATASQGGQP